MCCASQITVHTALGESPRTPLAPWSTEKAETHPHKSNFRGLPSPHLFYPHNPILDRWYSSRILLRSRERSLRDRVDEDMSPSSTDLCPAWLGWGVGRGGHDCAWMRGRGLIGAWMGDAFVEIDRYVIAFF